MYRYAAVNLLQGHQTIPDMIPISLNAILQNIVSLPWQPFRRKSSYHYQLQYFLLLCLTGIEKRRKLLASHSKNRLPRIYPEWFRNFYKETTFKNDDCRLRTEKPQLSSLVRIC